MAPFKTTSPAPTSRAFSGYAPRIVVVPAIRRLEGTGSSASLFTVTTPTFIGCDPRRYRYG